jgi:hypothetical protein
LAYAYVVLLGQGFELVVEASGNNYVRITFLSHVSTKPLRLLFCAFEFLNGSMEFSVMVSSSAGVGKRFSFCDISRSMISLAVWKYPLLAVLFWWLLSLCSLCAWFWRFPFDKALGLSPQKKRSGCLWVYTRHEPVDSGKAVEVLEAFKKVCEEGGTPPSQRWKCRSCEYKKTCPVKHALL